MNLIDLLIKIEHNREWAKHQLAVLNGTQRNLLESFRLFPFNIMGLNSIHSEMSTYYIRKQEKIMSTAKFLGFLDNTMKYDVYEGIVSGIAYSTVVEKIYEYINLMYNEFINDEDDIQFVSSENCEEFEKSIQFEIIHNFAIDIEPNGNAIENYLIENLYPRYLDSSVREEEQKDDELIKITYKEKLHYISLNHGVIYYITCDEMRKKLEMMLHGKQRLKSVRMSIDMTQGELAYNAVVSLRTLQDYEQGRKPIDGASLSTLLSLCDVLGCRVEDIVEDSKTIYRLKKIYG